MQLNTMFPWLRNFGSLSRYSTSAYSQFPTTRMFAFKTCGEKFFPPREICPECRSKGKLQDLKFSGKGVVETYTVIHIAPDGFEELVPYTVAIVRLEEGPTISGQVVGDPKKVAIGKQVKSVFRRMYSDGKTGLIHYGLKFELVEKA